MQHPRPSRLRSAFAVVAASALLVAGVTTVSEAAGAAKAVLLGKSNKETKTTKIINKKKKPALALKSKGSGPALSVNTTGLVTNLNADLLDGKTLEQVSPTQWVATIGTAGGAGANNMLFSTTSIPAGTYAVKITGIVSPGATDFNECLALDYTRYVASGFTDFGSIFALENQPDDEVSVYAEGVGTVTAGNQVVLGCQSEATTTFIQPVRITFQRLEGVATIPGTSPFVPRGGRITLP